MKNLFFSNFRRGGGAPSYVPTPRVVGDHNFIPLFPMVSGILKFLYRMRTSIFRHLLLSN